MANPPLPPKPRESINPNPGPPPPIPPLPPDLRQQTERYNTPSRYELESPPHFENPLIAPRPHRLDHSIPSNMARTLDDQVYQQQQTTSINYTPGFVIPNAYTQPVVNITQSIANLSMVPIPQPPPPPKPASPPPSPPSLTAPLPILSQLQAAANQVQVPSHDPALKIAWCRDVFFLVDRSQGNSAATDPPVGPVTISDPALSHPAHIAVQIALQLASSWSPGEGRPKMPLHVAEAISIRATLASTGSFPEFVRHNPRTAFRDFEAAARGGFVAAWFRLGRDYENFNDHAHAKECFERGAKLGVESCIYRMGMAHLLGQLSLPPSTTLALPLLNRAALLSSISTPQPSYVYALLLLSEFTQLTVPPALFAPFIPAGSSPTLEARKHLERAAYLHFPAAQYKLGHAYEFAEPPFAFDPLLSVQYYSLASQQGEVEADMALSKWFLCGSGGAAAAAGGDVNPSGGFEKDEALALTFAEKAAKKGLPAAEFAMGYYAEVGVGQPRDVGKSVYWYKLAHSHGNSDASARLAALSQSNPQSLSRQEHDTITEAKLVRRRTQAAIRSDTQPVSPPWEGMTFPNIHEMQEKENLQVGGPPIAPGPGRAGRRRQDGRMVVDVIRKNSLASGYGTSAGAAGPPASASGRMPALRESSPQRQSRRYDWDGANAPPASSSNLTLSSSPQRIASPGRRTESPGLSNSPSPGRPVGGRNPSPVPGSGRSKLERMRLNLDDPAPIVPSAPTPSSNGGGNTSGGSKVQGYSLVDSAPTALSTGAPPMDTPKPTTASAGGKKPQTFAEMGFQGAKADDKDCVIM